jgi:hypothetical protein
VKRKGSRDWFVVWSGKSCEVNPRQPKLKALVQEARLSRDRGLPTNGIGVRLFFGTATAYMGNASDPKNGTVVNSEELCFAVSLLQRVASKPYLQRSSEHQNLFDEGRKSLPQGNCSEVFRCRLVLNPAATASGSKR